MNSPNRLHFFEITNLSFITNVLHFAFNLPTAISEECSDELLASSATSSPPNGFMAPLKKRRVVRQCSDLNSEDVPSPKEDIKEAITEEGKF